MLGLILLGFSNITSINGIILVILGIVLLLIFIKWELNVQTPVLDLSLFRNRTFAFSNLATVISYIGLYGVGYLMSLYLQYIKGFNPVYLV